MDPELQAGEESVQETTTVVLFEYWPGMGAWKTSFRVPNAGPGRLCWPLAGSTTASDRLGASMVLCDVRPGAGSESVRDAGRRQTTGGLDADEGLEAGKFSGRVVLKDVLIEYWPDEEAWKTPFRIPNAGPGRLCWPLAGSSTASDRLGASMVLCCVRPGDGGKSERDASLELIIGASRTGEGLEAGKFSGHGWSTIELYSPVRSVWKTPSRQPHTGPGRLCWSLAGISTVAVRLGAPIMLCDRRPGDG